MAVNFNTITFMESKNTNLSHLLPLGACLEARRWLSKSKYTNPNKALENAPNEFLFWLVEYVDELEGLADLSIVKLFYKRYDQVFNFAGSKEAHRCLLVGTLGVVRQDIKFLREEYVSSCVSLAIAIIKNSLWWGNVLKVCEIVNKKVEKNT